ncbi:Envelope glycoprotein [Conoideocrella luteorostrata]|uniref:Envelope glycoprotein n=1 Tax=Conoideocrella luteorostrata TaxID=1105319 RepID=A0AAJ0CPA1_9HYPO|nr:Envelope glycoprotein [Conoideocrella luteorostrata]
MSSYPPGKLISFGPNANCTLSTCPLEMSVYKYRPSLPVNALFIALFALAAIIHVVLGIRWRSWGFMVFMIFGCLVEIVGYGARIVLYKNPFSFMGFLIQIIFITTGPVFYTAAIYVTLSKTIYHLAPKLSRFNPKLFYWIFIPFDIVCLALQAAGGALSTSSNGSSDTGVNITMAGLILQVVVIFAFIVAFADYIVRYVRNPNTQKLSSGVRVFLSFLALAIVLILGRCIYRAYELSQGYRNSTLITDEVLFIVLEGVLVIVSVYALCVGHPGLFFSRKESNLLSNRDVEKST